jgi:GT2 family glycosyltransferase
VVSSGLPRPESPSVVLTIATRDGRHLLEKMLPSIAAQRFRDFRLVVVDDASSDGTGEWMAEHWPEADVVALERNVGVTAAFNVCLQAIGDAEFVALFNNDMELGPDCLGELVATLRRHPEAGFAGAKLLDFHRRDVLDGAGDVFHWGGTGWRRGHGERDFGQYDEARAVFGACGGAALYRRTAIESVGGFYEPFFAFVEDVDWSFRAQLAGVECRYVPTAVAYHMGSATLGAGMTDFTRYHLTRNGVWLVARDYPAGALVRQLPRLLHAQAASLLDARRNGQLGTWARAWRDALRGLPAALRDRRDGQRRRRVPLRRLETVIAADRDGLPR